MSLKFVSFQSSKEAPNIVGSFFKGVFAVIPVENEEKVLIDGEGFICEIRGSERVLFKDTGKEICEDIFPHRNPRTYVNPNKDKALNFKPPDFEIDVPSEFSFAVPVPASINSSFEKECKNVKISIEYEIFVITSINGEKCEVHCPIYLKWYPFSDISWFNPDIKRLKDTVSVNIKKKRENKVFTLLFLASGVVRNEKSRNHT